MKAKRVLVALLVTAALSVSLYFLQRETKKIETQMTQSAAKVADREGEDVPPPTPSAFATPGQSVAAPPSVPPAMANLKAPSPQAIKKEREANPHGTPGSLLLFAQKVSPHMERALANESYALGVFTWFENCSSNAELGPVIQTYCTTNAARLARTHPGALQKRYQNMKQGLSSEVLDLLPESAR